jgi:hypothetical protein
MPQRNALESQFIMMRASRFSIAGMVGFVLFAVLALAAMRLGSGLLAGITYLVTCGVLCLAFIALMCRGPAERAWWLGFNVFGWICDKTPFREWGEVRPWLPTTRLLELLATMSGFAVDTSRPARTDDPWVPFFTAGHCLFTLLAAVVGGLVAVALFGDRLGTLPGKPVERQPEAVTLRHWWLGPSIIYVLVFAMAAALAVLCSGTDPEVWAGATFLLTWALIGLAGVGAVVGRGRRREVCIGASLMGVGFMLLVFSRTQEYQEWPGFPTIQFLNALRPWLPPAASGSPADSYEMAVTNARIRAALKQTVPMQFSDVTLKDLLKYVQDATRSPDGWTIPVEVVPVGLKEAENSLESTVSIDLEGVALETSLKHALRQLDLNYDVSDGMLNIDSSLGEYYLHPPDPYLVAGQCIMALLAIGVGGILAPIVSDVRQRDAA